MHFVLAVADVSRGHIKHLATGTLSSVKKDSLKKMSGNKSVLAQQYQAQMSITRQMGLRDKPEDLISSIIWTTSKPTKLAV